jgi:hypothetical protein
MKSHEIAGFNVVGVDFLKRDETIPNDSPEIAAVPTLQNWKFIGFTTSSDITNL